MKILVDIFTGIILYIAALSGLTILLSLIFSTLWYFVSNEFTFVWEYDTMPKLITFAIFVFMANYLIEDYTTDECERHTHD